MVKVSGVADAGCAGDPSGEAAGSKSKHTPGPWTVANRSVITPLTTIVGPGGPEERIAQWVHLDNADLISVAPDLLCALKELAAAYDNYDGGSISEKRIQAACDAAETAIAKAEPR